MNKKDLFVKIIIIFGIAIIPIFYSFFYLNAFWDPYSRIEGMPVALVNQDKGNDEENLGLNLINNMLEEKSMDFQVVDYEKAKEGLENKKYYAILLIPENFTENLNSAKSENKQISKIIYSPNQKTNYIASQILNTAVNKIEMKLQAEVAEKIVNNLTDSLNDVPDNLEKLNDAAKKLQDGNISLRDGLSTINNGMDSLDENYNKFNEGIEIASNGTKSLDIGIDTLNSGLDELYSGSKNLSSSAEGLTQITNGASELSKKGNELNLGLNSYVDGVNLATEKLSVLLNSIIQYAQANPQVLADENFKGIFDNILTLASSGQLDSLKNSGITLKNASEEYNQGIERLANATNNLLQLTSGIKEIESGIQRTKTGVQELKKGSAQLSDGADTLRTSSLEIKDGISQLKNGSRTALDGSQKLLNGQTEFVDTVDIAINDARDELNKTKGISEFTKNPVEIVEEDYQHVESYGVGLAPYFMSLSLWVGGLIIFVGIYMDSRNRFKHLGREAKNKILRSLAYVGIAIIQAILLAAILKWSLGYQIANVAMYYGVCILISIVFLSIIQFLMVHFGDVGKFLTILILVLQLSACGGTFPMETIPNWYRVLQPFMPMTYSLDLLKEATIGITDGFAAHDATVLIVIMFIFLGATLVLDFIKMKKEK